MKIFRVGVGVCATLFIAVAGTGSVAGGATGAPATSEPPAIEPTEPVAAATVAAPSATDESAEASGESEWATIVPGGDCECADGGEFSFFDRQADPTTVVFFLEGGGACFSAESCAFTDEPSTTYDWNIGADEHPDLIGGIFDLANEQNPFGDHSMVYVPYCTGDVHLGDATREYSPELTVEHNGYVNATTALAYLAENYPDAEQVVVVGESAGAIASPLYGGLVSDLLPDAQVTVFADGSAGYVDEPALNAAIGGFWGLENTVPDWPVNEGITPEEWSFPAFFVQAGTHDPDIVMSRFDFAYDGTQSFFLSLSGVEVPLLESIDANEDRIEAEGVDQLSYTAPGSEHTLVRKDEFYDMEVNGALLVDWVTDVVNGEPVEDVRCEDCEAP